MKFVACLLLPLSFSAFAVSSEFDVLATQCDAGWRRAMANWCERTSLVYTCAPQDVKSSAGCVGRMFAWSPDEKSYGRGMADCALICGTALSGLVDRFAVLGDKESREWAAKIARGVLNLATLHGIKGFVARGVCPDDGKTICSLSSRDQYTHWVHGLWRYVNSPMADPKLVAEYRALIVDVARFMEERVTPERGYNFGLADGGRDPRGICTMWGELMPHEWARLPMIYLAAYDATGDLHWHDLYERFIDAALDRTLIVADAEGRKLIWRMPCYSLYQVNASLELIYMCEMSPSRREKATMAMRIFANAAQERAVAMMSNPSRNPPYGMCWDGELLLTQLMVPESELSGGLRRFLDESVHRVNLTKSDVCRQAHIMAALWRAMNMGTAPKKVVLHVSPVAKPGGDGSADRPYNSLLAARDGLREKRIRAEVRKDVPVDILLSPGDYILNDTLCLDIQDCGMSERSLVTWRAETGTTVRVIGAHCISAMRFKPVEDNLVLDRLPCEVRDSVRVADVSAELLGELPPFPSSFEGEFPLPILFANHHIAALSRWPNSGYVSFSRRIDKGHAEVSRPDFYYGGAFVFDNSRVRRWDFSSGVWLNGYWTHDWHNASVRAERWGEECGTNGVMRLAGGVRYGVMAGTWGGKDRRFYAFNMLEELDAPGEWWLDRAHKLLYIVPSEGVDGRDAVFLAVKRYPLVRSIRPLSHLAFENIIFEYSGGDGLLLSGKCIRVEKCRVSCCGGGGIALSGAKNAISECEISDVGMFGIKMSGGNRLGLIRADSVVEKCNICRFGVVQRTYAPGVWVDGCGIAVRGNEIWDAPHCAVVYGGNEHLFDSNNVHHVLYETGDAGAFYTGRDWTTQGNILRLNKVHDLGMGTITSVGSVGEVAVTGANTMGFYFDDCDCGDAVYSNEFCNVARGIMIGGGRDHPIVGNVFSNCLIGLSIDCRGMIWKNWNTKGSGWNLEEKAHALDYTNGVWAARYPRLANIMNDHPREPLYNPVVGNTFIDCTGELLLLDKCAPIERMAPIRDNSVVYTAPPEVVRRAKINSCIADGFCVRECQKDSQGH